MRKNEPVKCYGFVTVYYHSFLHTLCESNIMHAIFSWLSAEEIWRCLLEAPEIM